MKALNQCEPYAIYVDDEVCLLDIFGEVIENKGFKLRGFSNSKEALQEIKSNPLKYQVLITDFHMPEMNGIQFLKILKEEDYYSLNYISIFSTMIGSYEFLDKFKAELGSNDKRISLIDKNCRTAVKELERFLENVKRKWNVDTKSNSEIEQKLKAAK